MAKVNAGSGIGRAAPLPCALDGAALCLVDCDGPAVKAVANETGGNVLVRAGDVPRTGARTPTDDGWLSE